MSEDHQGEELPQGQETMQQPADPAGDLVEGWWREHFPGSAVERADAAWRVAFEAKERLKHLLREHIEHLAKGA